MRLARKAGELMGHTAESLYCTVTIIYPSMQGDAKGLAGMLSVSRHLRGSPLQLRVPCLSIVPLCSKRR